MKLMRSPLLSLLMVLVLALTGHSMAAARAMSSLAGYNELCTGTGPLMVAVDENGEPVGPPHICPDFALHGFDLGVHVASLPEAPTALVRLAFVSSVEAGLSSLGVPPQARGPPVFL